MRTIEIYTFEELGSDAITVAINEIKTEMERNEQYEAFNWAVDDCSLFEPTQDTMYSIFGNLYNNKFADNGFLFKNTRKGIVFNNGDGVKLYINDALEIQDISMFKTWLGIPDELHELIDYELYKYSGNTQLSLTLNSTKRGTKLKLKTIFKMCQSGESKFKTHMDYIFDRIETSIEEYFSIESVIEKISNNKDYEFTSDGHRYINQTQQ